MPVNDGWAIDYIRAWLLGNPILHSIDVSFTIDCLCCFRNRFSIEGRISKVTGGAARVIQNRKIELPILFANASTSPDNLLKVCHGVDQAEKYHVLHRRHIHPGGEEPGGRNY